MNLTDRSGLASPEIPAMMPGSDCITMDCQTRSQWSNHHTLDKGFNQAADVASSAWVLGDISDAFSIAFQAAATASNPNAKNLKKLGGTAVFAVAPILGAGLTKTLAKRAGDLLGDIPTKKLPDLLNAKIFKTSRKGDKITRQAAKEGGFDQAVKDFESLTVGRKVTHTTKGYKRATLRDGREAIVRDYSTEGRITLEVQEKNAKGTVTDRVKIRYDK